METKINKETIIKDLNKRSENYFQEWSKASDEWSKALDEYWASKDKLGVLEKLVECKKELADAKDKNKSLYWEFHLYLKQLVDKLNEQSNVEDVLNKRDVETTSIDSSLFVKDPTELFK